MGRVADSFEVIQQGWVECRKGASTRFAKTFLVLEPYRLVEMAAIEYPDPTSQNPLEPFDIVAMWDIRGCRVEVVSSKEDSYVWSVGDGLYMPSDCPVIFFRHFSKLASEIWVDMLWRISKFGTVNDSIIFQPPVCMQKPIQKVPAPMKLGKYIWDAVTLGNANEDCGIVQSAEEIQTSSQQQKGDSLHLPTVQKLSDTVHSPHLSTSSAIPIERRRRGGVVGPPLTKSPTPHSPPSPKHFSSAITEAIKSPITPLATQSNLTVSKADYSSQLFLFQSCQKVNSDMSGVTASEPVQQSGIINSTSRSSFSAAHRWSTESASPAKTQPSVGVVIVECWDLLIPLDSKFFCVVELEHSLAFPHLEPFSQNIVNLSPTHQCVRIPFANSEEMNLPSPPIPQSNASSWNWLTQKIAPSLYRNNCLTHSVKVVWKDNFVSIPVVVGSDKEIRIHFYCIDTSRCHTHYVGTTLMPEWKFGKTGFTTESYQIISDRNSSRQPYAHLTKPLKVKYCGQLAKHRNRSPGGRRNIVGRVSIKTFCPTHFSFFFQPCPFKVDRTPQVSISAMKVEVERLTSIWQSISIFLSQYDAVVTFQNRINSITWCSLIVLTLLLAPERVLPIFFCRILLSVIYRHPNYTDFLLNCSLKWPLFLFIAASIPSFFDEPFSVRRPGEHENLAAAENRLLGGKRRQRAKRLLKIAQLTYPRALSFEQRCQHLPTYRLHVNSLHQKIQPLSHTQPVVSFSGPMDRKTTYFYCPRAKKKKEGNDDSNPYGVLRIAQTHPSSVSVWSVAGFLRLALWSAYGGIEAVIDDMRLSHLYSCEFHEKNGSNYIPTGIDQGPSEEDSFLSEIWENQRKPVFATITRALRDMFKLSFPPPYGPHILDSQPCPTYSNQTIAKSDLYEGFASNCLLLGEKKFYSAVATTELKACRESDVHLEDYNIHTENGVTDGAGWQYGLYLSSQEWHDFPTPHTMCRRRKWVKKTAGDAVVAPVRETRNDFLRVPPRGPPVSQRKTESSIGNAKLRGVTRPRHVKRFTESDTEERGFGRIIPTVREKKWNFSNDRFYSVGNVDALPQREVERELKEPVILKLNKEPPKFTLPPDTKTHHSAFKTCHQQMEKMEKIQEHSGVIKSTGKEFTKSTHRHYRIPLSFSSSSSLEHSKQLKLMSRASAKWGKWKNTKPKSVSFMRPKGGIHPLLRRTNTEGLQRMVSSDNLMHTLVGQDVKRTSTDGRRHRRSAGIGFMQHRSTGWGSRENSSCCSESSVCSTSEESEMQSAAEESPAFEVEDDALFVEDDDGQTTLQNHLQQHRTASIANSNSAPRLNHGHHRRGMRRRRQIRNTESFPWIQSDGILSSDAISREASSRYNAKHSMGGLGGWRMLYVKGLRGISTALRIMWSSSNTFERIFNLTSWKEATVTSIVASTILCITLLSFVIPFRFIAVAIVSRLFYSGLRRGRKREFALQCVLRHIIQCMDSMNALQTPLAEFSNSQKRTLRKHIEATCAIKIPSEVIEEFETEFTLANYIIDRQQIDNPRLKVINYGGWISNFLSRVPCN